MLRKSGTPATDSAVAGFSKAERVPSHSDLLKNQLLTGSRLATLSGVELMCFPGGELTKVLDGEWMCIPGAALTRLAGVESACMPGEELTWIPDGELTFIPGVELTWIPNGEEVMHFALAQRHS